MVANQLGLCHKPMGLLDTNHFFGHLIEMLEQMERDGFYNLSAAKYLIVDPQPERLLQRLSEYVPDADCGPVARRLRNKA